MKHEFSTAWHTFLYPVSQNDDTVLTLDLSENHFPFFAADKALNVKQIDVLIQSKTGGDYTVIMEAKDKADDTVKITTAELNTTALEKYAHLKVVSITEEELNIEDVDVKDTVRLTINYTPNDVPLEEDTENVFLVVHYSL